MVWSSARKYSPARSAMAKLIPSAEMPKPENIGRIVTGPKSENRSIRKSRSMDAALSTRRPGLEPGPIRRGFSFWRWGSRASVTTEAGGWVPAFAGTTQWLNLRGRQLHGFAAAAGPGLVRVVEDELRRHLVDLVIHLGAQQEQHGLGIDQDLHALVLDDLVGRANLMGVFDRIGLPGAATVLDPYPQAHDLRIGAFGQLGNPLRRRVGQLHDLRAGPRLGFGCRRWCSGCHVSHVVNPKGKSMPAILQ